MHRRKFLIATTTATTVAATGFGASVPSGQAFGQLAQPPGKGFVVKAGEDRFGEHTKLFGRTPNDIKVSAKDTNSTLTLFEYGGREKGGPPLHINPDQDKIFYVMEGRYLFDVSGERHTLAVGDLVFAPRNTPHTFAQLTDTGRLLFLVQPAGKMEAYFRTLGKLTGKLSLAEGAKLFADHGMQLVGPPLPVE